MADPLSLVALGAAVGGAAGKFVEKAWDSGEKWITSYFADHRPKAIAQPSGASTSRPPKPNSIVGSDQCSPSQR